MTTARKQRILCVCQGGNCRSVHLAYVLKYSYGVDALACGYEGNTHSTLEMLCGWSDYIIVVQPQMMSYIPERFQEKVRVFDVGPDRFFQPNNELLDLFNEKIIGQIRSIDDKPTDDAHPISPPVPVGHS